MTDQNQQEDFFSQDAVMTALPDTQEDDFFSQDAVMGTTAFEKASALGKGFGGAALETGGTVGGAILGAKAGIAGGPWGVAAGTIVGGLAGYYAGSEAKDALEPLGVTAEVKNIPPELRPYFVAGESFGGAIAVTGAPFAMAKLGIYTAGKTIAGRWLNDVIHTAIKHPTTFIGAEISAGTSAAIGAGLAEEHAPGNIYARTGAEITGGILNPTRLVISSTRGMIHRVQQVSQLFSAGARESAAGKILFKIIEEHGEDPILIARLLKEAGLPGLEQTAAQKTGSRALGALQAKLSESSAQFGNESKRMAEEGLDGIRSMIRALHHTGDPEALRLAAQVRRTYFKTLLAGRVQAAELKAHNAARAITKDTPATRMELSRVARETLNDALHDARLAETELWNVVPKDIPASTESIVSRFHSIKADLLPEVRAEKLPTMVRKFIQRMIKQEEISSTGELKQFRSEMLEQARKATYTGDFGQARIYGELAEAALDDMDGVFAGISVTGDDTADLYNAARAFSRELNDTFTRTFAGRAMAETKRGARIPPELLLHKATAGGKEAAALQLQELEEATRFLVQRGLTDDTSVKTMLDVQERIIRLAAADSIDPITGKIVTKQLAKFVRDNDVLMNRFPEIKKDLTKAVSSEIDRVKIESMSKNSMDIIEKQTALAKLTDGDPVIVAQRALSSAEMEKELNALIKVAHQGGIEAMEGARASVFDAAIRKSTSTLGTIQLNRLRSILFEPPIPGGKSAIEILKEGGVLNDANVNLIEKLFKAADNISIAQKPGTAIEAIEDVPDILMDFVTRVFGAGMAGRVAKATGSEAHGLIVAQRGSAAARDLIGKLPQKRIRLVLVEAMNNPKFMTSLMEKVPTQAKKIEKLRQIHAYMIQAGFYNMRESFAPESPEQTVGAE